MIVVLLFLKTTLCTEPVEEGYSYGEEIEKIDKCECDGECGYGKYCKIPIFQLDWRTIKHYPCAKHQHRYPRFFCQDSEVYDSKCLRDKQCLSGKCRKFKCVPCDNDYHCGYGFYCKFNQCKPSRRFGFCTRNTQCQGRCIFFFCWWNITFIKIRLRHILGMLLLSETAFFPPLICEYIFLCLDYIAFGTDF